MSSKSWQAALTGAATIAVLSVGVRAQQGPRELFERAKLLEQSGRQSARVVAMYEEVATKADSALAAAARLQIAMLKEREGQSEARALLHRHHSRLPGPAGRSLEGTVELRRQDRRSGRPLGRRREKGAGGWMGLGRRRQREWTHRDRLGARRL